MTSVLPPPMQTMSGTTPFLACLSLLDTMADFVLSVKERVSGCVSDRSTGLSCVFVVMIGLSCISLSCIGNEVE